jgi:hypothetical protein
MKKVLLPALFMFAAAFSNAQSCLPKFTTTGLYDGFTTAEPFNADKSGIYQWGAAKGNTTNPGFSAEEVRDTVKHMLNVNINQTAGGYVPFGTSFGNAGGVSTGTPFYTDLSGNAKFSITVTNNSTTTDIKFRMTIVDDMGKEIDTYVAYKPDSAAFAKPYLYTIETVILKGATVTFAGDYTGGVKADYAAKKYVGGFHFNKVAGIHYTVVNKAVDASYAPLVLTDCPISISSLQLGNCAAKVGAGINELNTVTSSVIYPNPTSESFTAAIELKEISNVKVTLNDLTGREISVVANTKTASLNEVINVSTLAKGTYMVKFNVNGADAVTKLLMVK